MNKIGQELCKCGHPKYTHNVFNGACEVRKCHCTLYSQPQKVVCPTVNKNLTVESLASTEMLLITCPVDKTLRNYKGCFEGCEFYKRCEVDMLKARIKELEDDAEKKNDIINQLGELLVAVRKDKAMLIQDKADERQKAFREVGEWLDARFEDDLRDCSLVYQNEITNLKSGKSPREE